MLVRKIKSSVGHNFVTPNFNRINQCVAFGPLNSNDGDILYMTTFINSRKMVCFNNRTIILSLVLLEVPTVVGWDLPIVSAQFFET